MAVYVNTTLEMTSATSQREGKTEWSESTRREKTNHINPLNRSEKYINTAMYAHTVAPGMVDS